MEQTAEFVSRYFHKVDDCRAGSIQARSYEDKQGIKRKAVEIVADNASFCGSKSESGTGPRNDYAAPAAAPAPAYATGNMGDFEEIQDDDDLPF